MWSHYGKISRVGASLQEELDQKWREELSKEGRKGSLVRRREGKGRKGKDRTIGKDGIG